MALKSPVGVHDTFNSSGTTSFTLTGDAPTGRRSLANAVTAGHIANGDTMYYYAWDDTTEEGTYQFEFGLGTVSSAGAVLSRDTVIQSSNGGTSKVSWGSGGARDIVASFSLSGLAQLAAANTFTALQTLSAGLTSGDAITVEKATTTLTNALALRNASAGSTSNLVSSSQNLKDSGGTYRAALAIASDLPTITAGSDTSRVRFFCRNGGAETVAFQILNGGLANGSGTAYALTTSVSGVLNAPSGGRLLWGVSTIPAGWSIVGSLADRTILTTSTASEIDDVGGAWAVSGLSGTMTSGITVTVNGHALNQTELPAVNFLVTGPGTIGGSGTAHTTLSGSGNTHTHTATASTAGSTSVSSDGTWRPSYYKAGWIAKS